jgi:non-haem Fe2+, alpha-ketoglutarate-dependent halogenase
MIFRGFNKMEDDELHPPQTSNAQPLSEDQVTQFNENGYVNRIRVFDTDEVLAQRDYFDRLLKLVLAGGEDSYSISGGHLTYGKVYDLLTSTRLVALVKSLLGPNVVAWGSHYFCKLAGDGRVVSWHQDASYWALTPCKALTVWLAIDDADRFNACMKFIAGSHRLGHLTFRESEPSENNVLEQSIDNAEQLGEVVWNELLRAKSPSTLICLYTLLMQTIPAEDAAVLHYAIVQRTCAQAQD